VRDVVRSCLTGLETSPAGLRGRFRFPPDLAVFAGHFPGLPIVPGVFLVEAARRVAEEAAGKPLRIAGVDEAKFTAEVGPGETVEVDVALGPEPASGGWSARAAVSAAKGAAARIRLRLVEEESSQRAP